MAMLYRQRTLQEFRSMCSQLQWVLCVLPPVLGHACLMGQELPVPYEIKVNAAVWSLSVTWKSPLYSKTLLYEVQVLQEDNSTPIHHEILTDTVNQDAMSQSFTIHHWEWISSLPLNCILHSVKVRSRCESQTSQWSSINVTDTSEELKVYPVDPVVLVGSHMSFCCVVKKEDFISFEFNDVMKNKTWVGNHVAVIDLQNLNATPSSGNDIQCKTRQGVFGSTVFVGYPPDDHDLQCETDLQSVTCFWEKGRGTSLWGNRDTTYTLNGSPCTGYNIRKCKLPGHPPSGETNWTLVAENPLGRAVLKQKVDLSHRVVLQAPQQLKILKSSRSASVSWNWNPLVVVNFEVQCEVNLTYGTDNRGDRQLHTSPPTRKYLGVGLSTLLLEKLLPATMYHLKVHCGKQENFWKWSFWSSTSFHTNEDSPDTPDLWFQRDGNKTLHVMWKPLSWSNGWLTEYKVTWKKLIDGMEQTIKVEPPQHTTIINLGEHSHHHAVMVTVTASNSVGSSPPAVIMVPGEQGDYMPAISRVSGVDGGFELSWSPHNSPACGYVVEWHPAHVKKDVEWLKVPTGQTHTRIESASFVAGEKYNLAIYSCQAKLLERKEGYVWERVPAVPVQNLKVKEEGADAVLSWGRIPPQSCRGFIRGYIIRCNLPDVQKVNVTDPDVLEYRFSGLPPNIYQFTVTAYTQIGESAGQVVSIHIAVDVPMVLAEMMIIIAVISCLLVIVMVICYRYRGWLKMMFCSVVPQPKISSEWLAEKGALLIVIKPCIYDQLHIVEKQDETAKLKLNREISFFEDTHYSLLEVQKPYKPGLSGQLKSQPTHCPESPPSGPVLPFNSPVSNEITYTKIQTFPEVLDVSPQRPEPQMNTSSLGVSSTLPKTAGSYLPQSASQEDRPPAEDHLDRPVFNSSSSSSQPNLSPYSAPSSCCAINNPTYCPTFPAQFSSPL